MTSASTRSVCHERRAFPRLDRNIAFAMIDVSSANTLLTVETVEGTQRRTHDVAAHRIATGEDQEAALIDEPGDAAAVLTKPSPRSSHAQLRHDRPRIRAQLATTDSDGPVWMVNL